MVILDRIVKESFSLEVVFEEIPDEEIKRVNSSEIWGETKQRPSCSDTLGLFQEKEDIGVAGTG